MNSLYIDGLKQALAHGDGFQLAAGRHNSGVAGRRTGRNPGSSMEFSDYREYHAGDDLRRLDWSVYARSEQLMVKLFNEEVDPRCDIIVDDSKSMTTPSVDKAVAALGLSGILAQAANTAGFSLAVWRAGEKMQKEFNASRPLEWHGERFTAAAGPNVALAEFGGGFFRRGMRMVISDFLWSEPPEHFFRRLVDNASCVVLLEVLSEFELKPELNGHVLLTDAESGEEKELLIDESMLKRYTERLMRHRSMWRQATQEYNVRMLSFEAGELQKSWDLKELFKCGVLQ